MTILAKLKAPFPADAISWRVGSTTADKSKGMALAFIDARDVMQRLDDVMGVDWQCEYVPMPNGTCCCRIGLLIDGHWRWRSNGAINLSDSDKSDAKEMAEKGSYSDAFKRAAVLWGVGQYLYNLASPWVALEPRGRSYTIAPGEMAKLETLLRRGGAPSTAPKAVDIYVGSSTASFTPPPAAPSPAALASSQAPLARDPKAEALDRRNAHAKRAEEVKASEKEEAAGIFAQMLDEATKRFSALKALKPADVVTFAGHERDHAVWVQTFKACKGRLSISDKLRLDKGQRIIDDLLKARHAALKAEEMADPETGELSEAAA